MKKTLSVVLLTVFILSCIYAYAVNVPYLTGRVTDNAQILSEETRDRLTELLKTHEAKTTNQIAVLTIPSLEGEGIEEYAVAVFEEWKLGQKGKDNGILLIVAPNDRRMRIEVGYGLEGTMTDGMAGSIIRNVITPYFKNNDFNKGIEEGVTAIISVLEGGQAPADEPVTTEEKTTNSAFSDLETPDISITERILLGAFIFGIIGLFTVIGVLTPGVGWFLYFFLIPFWATFPIVVLGTTATLYLLITYLIVFPIAKLILKNSNWYIKAAKELQTKGQANIGGFTVTSGGSDSTWSSGGSSFSGGGGSSGGGGASGSW